MLVNVVRLFVCLLFQLFVYFWVRFLFVYLVDVERGEAQRDLVLELGRETLVHHVIAALQKENNQHGGSKLGADHLIPHVYFFRCAKSSILL